MGDTAHRPPIKDMECVGQPHKKRLVAGSRGTLRYEDLSEIIFGRRNGARSFSWSLGMIHDRTSQYNRKFKTKHPLLNALVFNQKGEQRGIPKSQKPDEIWNILEPSGPQYLDRLAVLLGYTDFSGHRSGFKNKHSGQAKDGAGAQSGGERSAAVWSARHSPWVKEIGDVLDKLGWKKRFMVGHGSPIYCQGCLAVTSESSSR